MNLFEQLKTQSTEIEEKINYQFKDKNLLYLAFIHSSFANECKDVLSQNYERLEFLGDSVLGIIISEYLYHRFFDFSEGKLSLLRASLVDANSCSNYLKSLKLEGYILLGKGERLCSGMEKTSIQADVFEAIIGAIYLDGGYEKAKAFIFDRCENLIEEIIKNPTSNFKADLQDYSQKNFQSTPVYEVTNETGPDHAKIFFVDVFIDGKKMGEGKGSSKKDAEQDAARIALTHIEKSVGNE